MALEPGPSPERRLGPTKISSLGPAQAAATPGQQKPTAKATPVARPVIGGKPASPAKTVTGGPAKPDIKKLAAPSNTANAAPKPAPGNRPEQKLTLQSGMAAVASSQIKTTPAETPDGPGTMVEIASHNSDGTPNIKKEVRGPAVPGMRPRSGVLQPSGFLGAMKAEGLKPLPAAGQTASISGAPVGQRLGRSFPIPT